MVPCLRGAACSYMGKSGEPGKYESRLGSCLILQCLCLSSGASQLVLEPLLPQALCGTGTPGPKQWLYKGRAAFLVLLLLCRHSLSWGWWWWWGVQSSGRGFPKVPPLPGWLNDEVGGSAGQAVGSEPIASMAALTPVQQRPCGRAGVVGCWSRVPAEPSPGPGGSSWRSFLGCAQCQRRGLGWGGLCWGGLRHAAGLLQPGEMGERACGQLVVTVGGRPSLCSKLPSAPCHWGRAPAGRWPRGQSNWASHGISGGCRFAPSSPSVLVQPLPWGLMATSATIGSSSLGCSGTICPLAGAGTCHATQKGCRDPRRAGGVAAVVGLLLHPIHHPAAERREDGGGQVLSVPNHAGSLLKLVAPPAPPLPQLPREPQPGGGERAPAAQAAAWVVRAVKPGLPPHQRVSSRAQWLQGWGDSHGCSSRVPPRLAAAGAGPCTDPSTIPVPELGGRGHRPVLSWLKLDGAHPTSGAVPGAGSPLGSGLGPGRELG